MNIAKIKDSILANKKKVAAFAITNAMMLSSVAAFAETTTTTDSSAALESINEAMLTSVNGTVAMMISLVVGLIPVLLQVLTAFVLFKFGKKFFRQVGT